VLQALDKGFEVRIARGRPAVQPVDNFHVRQVSSRSSAAFSH
jgi:hypothetical protein